MAETALTGISATVDVKRSGQKNVYDGRKCILGR